MRILVLGVGKTGKLVADVAAEHGHSVHVLDAKENKDAAALTPPFVAGFDVIVDFTTPEAVIANMRACLANGAKMVVGTTGWYDRLPRAKEAAERKGASLLYGTNFSIGVQMMLKLAGIMTKELAGLNYHLSISETPDQAGRAQRNRADSARRCPAHLQYGRYPDQVHSSRRRRRPACAGG